MTKRLLITIDTEMDADVHWVKGYPRTYYSTYIVSVVWISSCGGEEKGVDTICLMIIGSNEYMIRM